MNCRVCKKSFNRIDNLRRHEMKTCNAERLPCFVKIRVPRITKSHKSKSNVEVSNSESSELSTVSCKYCNKNFCRSDNRDRHERSFCYDSNRSVKDCEQLDNELAGGIDKDNVCELPQMKECKTALKSDTSVSTVMTKLRDSNQVSRIFNETPLFRLWVVPYGIKFSKDSKSFDSKNSSGLYIAKVSCNDFNKIVSSVEKHL